VPPLTSGLINNNCRAAGQLFPQPRIASAEGTVLLDRLSGHGWRLMVDGRTGLNAPDLNDGEIKTVILGGSGLSDTDHIAARWFDEHGWQIAIVRPDHYVYCGLEDIHSASLRWKELLQVIHSGVTAGSS